MVSYRKAALRHAEYFLNVAKFNQQNFEVLDRDKGNLDTAIATCLKFEEWKLLSRIIVLIGDFLVARNSWKEYKDYATMLLEKYEIDFHEKINLLDGVASIEEDQGHYDEARKLLDRRLQLIEESALDDKNIIDITLKKAIRLARSQGDHQGAINYLITRLLLAGKVSDYRKQCEIFVELARLYNEVGTYDKAEECCKMGLSIAQEMEYTIGVIDLMSELALVYINQKIFDQALIVLNQVMDIGIKTSDRRRVDIIQQLLSKVEKEMAKKIFISYNHHDRVFVEKLAGDLKAKGLSVWWDEWEIGVGDSIFQKVSDGIKSSAYLAVILSPESVQSPWVNREVGSATMRQLSEKRSITILPLLVADCEIPVLLGEIKWADFRTNYKLGLKDLLKTLL